MNPFFSHSNSEHLQDEADVHLAGENEAPHSITEGSEFLDDALRMKEMPLIFSGEKVDPGMARPHF